MTVIVYYPLSADKDEIGVIQRILTLHRVKEHTVITYSDEQPLLDQSFKQVSAAITQGSSEDDLFIFGLGSAGVNWHGFENMVRVIHQKVSGKQAPLVRFYWINEFFDSVTIEGVLTE